VEDQHVDELAGEEGHDRAGDDPEALAEDGLEGELHVDRATVSQLAQPPEVRRCQVDGAEHREEGVGDHAHCQEGQAPDAAFSEVLVDDVGHHEHDRPQEDARRQVEGQRLVDQRPDRERREAEGALQREELDSHEFGQDGVRDEEGAQVQEEPRGLGIGRVVHGAEG